MSLIRVLATAAKASSLTYRLLFTSIMIVQLVGVVRQKHVRKAKQRELPSQ